MRSTIIDLHQGNTMFVHAANNAAPHEAHPSIGVPAEEALNARPIKIACSNCNLRELCMPLAQCVLHRHGAARAVHAFDEHIGFPLAGGTGLAAEGAPLCRAVND